MNERIKELNLQALMEVLNGQDPDNDTDKMYIPNVFAEKFAELIVKECASYMNEYADNGDVRNGNDLLKRFGVEE